METMTLPMTALSLHVVPTIAISALLALAMITMAVLKGWQGWLALKERELGLRGDTDAPLHAMPATAARIELADLKERIRKLEAIASGVDL